jgi:hypothetical protein
MRRHRNCLRHARPRWRGSGPEWVAPQLTQLVDAAPGGDEWLHEIE